MSWFESMPDSHYLPMKAVFSSKAPKISQTFRANWSSENEQAVKYPKRLRYRGKGKVLATIYRRPDCYRLYWRARVDGKPRSQFKDFTTYSTAKREGDKVVAELAKGAQAARLTPGQATDALAAVECLRGFYEATGQKVSILSAVQSYCAAARKLGDRPLGEAVDGFLAGAATVKRMDVLKAVEQFIEERKQKTVAQNGKRPEISPEHHYNTSRWLLGFGKTFPGTSVCDLTKQHLDTFMQKYAKVGPKTRNEVRGVARMFLQWSVEKDYLTPTHRLFEAGGFKHEPADLGEIECFTADELRALLERASKQPGPAKDGEDTETDYRSLLPVIALGGLAGMRFKEVCRLAWDDVFRIPGHVEVKAAKAKTRSRRLIPICPALAGWLEPYRGRTGPVWVKGYDMLHEDFGDLRESLGVARRRNGLRHSFVSAHYAAYGDENLTAAQAGHSPAMIHEHYKGLLTKAEGLAWFAVSPARPENVVSLPTAASAS